MINIYITVWLSFTVKTIQDFNFRVSLKIFHNNFLSNTILQSNMLTRKQEFSVAPDKKTNI